MRRHRLARQRRTPRGGLRQCSASLSTTNRLTIRRVVGGQRQKSKIARPKKAERRRLEDAGDATARPYLEYRSERIFRQKRYKKVFRKKASERERHLNGNYALCILYALIMHIMHNWR